ncbi:hypothetical protein MMC30_003020 [Trapelia coarctata]|nr:hypothetical protein [Trapelia coarctata]
MSLSVNDPRSRGRSKSPGGRDRSRSRDGRAPSPAQPVKPSKTKKYYEPDSSEESSGSGSGSESDHRSNRRRPQERSYDDADSRYNRAPSPDTRSSALTRAAKYDEAADARYEQDHRDGRHPSYTEPVRYEPSRPTDYVRHPSYSRPADVPLPAPVAPSEYGPPGAYKWEYDHPEGPEKGSRPPPPAEHEATRGMSLNTSGNFHVEIGHGHSPHPRYIQPVAPPYGYQPASTAYTQPPHGCSQPPASAPPDHRTHSASISVGRQHYEVPEKYKYAETPQQITYVNKSSSHKPAYTQTAYPQPEVDPRRPARHASEIEIELGRRSSQYRTEIEGDDRRMEDRRRSRLQGEVDIDLVQRHSRHADEVALEERRPSRYAEVDVDVIRRPAHTTEYDRRRISQSHSQVVEVHPGGGSLHAPLSPGLGPRMHRLSVSGGIAGSVSLAAPGQHAHQFSGPPPGSPLLEAYHGTYQSISPMPSPLMLPSKFDEGLSDLEPLDGESPSSSSDDRHKPRRSILKKKVSIYDPEKDALSLASALNHHAPRTEPLIAILPHLSDDHVMALRTEYKKHIKVGGKGINIAKHIKLKVSGNLGKIAYATALGRWESEAHWANFWYLSGSSRRELLIESVMGRTNGEIRAIKEAFSDKRYSDSLEKCMQAELKKDKFRYAVLLALEEKRLDELSTVSKTLVRRDVDDLYKALVSKEGGETAMIDIIVVRSDTHLREVLREFELRYRKNFAREMIQKSKNLVGETLAHILNGVINRPVRDALLLHQALAETSKDRTELLISRLVRYHWEPKHLEKVKVEYKRKYDRRLERDLEEGTAGGFGEFVMGLLEPGR